MYKELLESMKGVKVGKGKQIKEFARGSSDAVYVSFTADLPPEEKDIKQLIKMIQNGLTNVQMVWYADGEGSGFVFSKNKLSIEQANKVAGIEGSDEGEM
jgi:hypothetical protein